jgi:hypothetical protein
LCSSPFLSSSLFPRTQNSKTGYRGVGSRLITVS